MKGHWMRGVIWGLVDVRAEYRPFMADRPPRSRKPLGRGPAMALALVSAVALGGLLWLTVVAQAGTGARRADGAHAVLASSTPRAWSPPSTVRACGVDSGPQVAFPSESPSTPTGPGAIVWASERPGCGALSAPSAGGPSGVGVAAIGPLDRAMLARTQSLGGSSRAGILAVGGSLGRITVAAPVQGPSVPAAGAAAVLQGRATRPLGSPTLLTGQGDQLALTRAYLGDVATATVVPGPAISVRVERYFQRTFGRARLIAIPAGRVTALTATMDYRSDVLVAWQQDGAIYAHMLRASGRPDPTQLVGPSAPDPQLRALVSDNDHGMIAWASTDSPKDSPARTRVSLDLSAAGVRFGVPRLLASFPDPQQVCLRASCLGLVRLSTENVMMAWTVAEHGRYVIRGAPAVFAATRPTTRLSDPGAQAVLVDLAAGPAGEAVALWESAPRAAGGFDARRTELWAARTVLGLHDRVGLAAPEMVAPAGPTFAPSVAVDPATDRAVAAWLTMGTPSRIDYAVGSGTGRYRLHTPVGVVSPAGPGTHWLRMTLIAGAAAAAVAALGLAMWRRRRPRGA
jgi:hypothetical protein